MAVLAFPTITAASLDTSQQMLSAPPSRSRPGLHASLPALGLGGERGRGRGPSCSPVTPEAWLPASGLAVLAGLACDPLPLPFLALARQESPLAPSSTLTRCGGGEGRGGRGGSENVPLVITCGWCWRPGCSLAVGCASCLVNALR